MRLCEYLELAKKMKVARSQANISQRDMAAKLSLGYSTYSNYENGYSEPPAEIILKFCDILDISLADLLSIKVEAPRSVTVETFSDVLNVLIQLDKKGVPVKGSVSFSESMTDKQSLIAHLNLDIKNAQIATFIPEWNKINQELKDGKIDEEDYEIWLNDTLKMFNVPISEFV